MAWLGLGLAWLVQSLAITGGRVMRLLAIVIQSKSNTSYPDLFWTFPVDVWKWLQVLILYYNGELSVEFTQAKLWKMECQSFFPPIQTLSDNMTV